jgi:RNA polymerase subunit RPABC4/transcription elongation factor Spt4
MARKEKPETKTCKHCKSEIPYDAKVCPQCRKRVSGGVIKWIVIVAAVLIVISAIASSGDDKSETKKVGEVAQSTTTAQASETDTQPAEDETAEPEAEAPEAEEPEAEEPEASEAPVQQTEYRVGDILQDGNLQIVYAASGVYQEENEYMQPDVGYQYIYIKLAVTNTSDSSDENISFYSFDCYADGYAVDQYYGGDEDLSATLSAGRSTSGYVYFTVPVDAQTIEIEYTTNYFTDEKMTFLYEGEQDSGYVMEQNTSATADAYAVGDIVESSELIISYLSCEEYVSDNMFVQPQDGYHYITCTFEFENQSDSDEYISSLDFDCYADGASCDQIYIRDDELSATLSAGRKVQGTVTFEVPLDATVVEVEYLTNYWTSNRVVFQAN